MRQRPVTLRLLAVIAAMLGGGVVLAQQSQTAPSAPSGTKTLAATINVYVFPTEGQDAAKQSKDEAQCYSWAVNNTGTDPFQLAKQAEQIQAAGQQAQEQASQAGPKHATGKGALGGAAVGALIGEIASDEAGAGAAIGGAAGAIAMRRRSRHAKEEASAQASAQTGQAMAANEEQVLNFKKAFSVCLEAQKYMVKY